MVSTVLPGPLLRLIALQDRGGLTYPNGSGTFVGLVKQVSEIAVKTLPHLKCDNVCEELTKFLYPFLIQNRIFKCLDHKNKACDFIIRTIVKPVLDNVCLESSDLVKKKNVIIKSQTNK
jgi:hypothetical protein